MKIIQEDRDAAAGYLIEGTWYEDSNLYPDSVREGHDDGFEIVQAFARHRLATHNSAIEETARVARMWQARWLVDYERHSDEFWKGGAECAQQIENDICALMEQSTSAKPSEAERLMDRFSQHHDLELTHYRPTYGDDDDQSVEWRVHQQSGSVNDREWTLVGNGETALEAVRAALRAIGAL
jgi:hypothetical protein